MKPLAGNYGRREAACDMRSGCRLFNVFAGAFSSASARGRVLAGCTPGAALQTAKPPALGRAALPSSPKAAPYPPVTSHGIRQGVGAGSERTLRHQPD